MTTYFTADHHFGHANIIEFCDRPFADVEEMNEELIRRWNETVKPNDIVMVLGDFAMGKIKETLPLVARLNGDISLLPGNHDRCWLGHLEILKGKKPERWKRWVDAYLDAGFRTLLQTSIETRSHPWLLDAHTRVQISHFPRDDPDDYRYVAYRPPLTDEWLLHGHVHEKWKVRGRMINVGVDVWDYRPVSEEALVALMVD